MFRVPASRPGLNLKRPGIGKSSVSIGSLLFSIRASSKIDENRRMYRVFAVKTRKNAIRSSIQEDERAKRRVLAVRTVENAARAAFSAVRTAKTQRFARSSS